LSWRLLYVLVNTAAAAAFPIALHLTRGLNAGVTGDAIAYLQGAIALAEDLRYATCDGAPVTGFPPLFSLLLALPMKAEASPLTAVLLVDALSTALAVGSLGLVLSRHVRSNVVFVSTLPLLALAFPYHLSVNGLFSEVPFTALQSLLVLMLDVALMRGRSYVLAAAAVAGMATVARYLGVVSIGLGGLVLLCRPLPLARRLADSILFGAIASLPLMAFIVRNLTYKQLTGHDEKLLSPGHDFPASSFFDAFFEHVRLVSNWFVFVPQGSQSVRTALFVGGAGVLAVLALRAMFRRDMVAAEDRNALILLTAYSIGYIVGVDVVVSLNDLPILDRYIAPAVLPLTACLILLIDIALRPSALPLARAAVPIVAALWFVLPLKNLSHLLLQETPIRTSAPVVRNSGLVAFVKGVEPDSLVGDREEDANFVVLHLGRCVLTRHQRSDGRVKYVVRTTSLGGTDMTMRPDGQQGGDAYAGPFGTVSVILSAPNR